MPVDLQTLVNVVLRQLNQYLDEGQEIKFSIPIDGTEVCYVTGNSDIVVNFSVKYTKENLNIIRTWKKDS